MMDARLANYLFNKETLYKNIATEAPKATAIEPVEAVKVVEHAISSVPTSPKEIKKSATPTYVFKHKVLILTDTISDSEKVLLMKILGAIGLTIEQVDLVELSKVQVIDYQSFIMQNITRKVVSFGVGFGKLNWNILLNIYQPKNVAGIDFLLSDELGVLDTNLDLKKTLWGALKAMFNN